MACSSRALPVPPPGLSTGSSSSSVPNSTSGLCLFPWRQQHPKVKQLVRTRLPSGSWMESCLFYSHTGALLFSLLSHLFFSPSSFAGTHRVSYFLIRHQSSTTFFFKFLIIRIYQLVTIYPLSCENTRSETKHPFRSDSSPLISNLSSPSVQYLMHRLSC